jgi:hypothetical protein
LTKVIYSNAIEKYYKFQHLLILTGFLFVGLTSCGPQVDPPGAFGLTGILSFCSGTTNDYSIFCKAAVNVNIKTEIAANPTTEYSMLFPTNAAMTIYFTQNNLNENDFLVSTDLTLFVKKYVLLGALIPGVSLLSLAGTSSSITGSASSLIINGSIAVGVFPYAVKIGTSLWLHSLDKTIQ